MSWNSSISQCRCADESESGVSGLSFTLNGFEKVGVIGKSGSGKSTLANLVAGFIAPDSGTVLLDGIPCDLTDSSWKHQVRIIPQNPYIFRGTLADNISFYTPDATRERIESAVHDVGLDELVDECSFSTNRQHIWTSKPNSN